MKKTLLASLLLGFIGIANAQNFDYDPNGREVRRNSYQDGYNDGFRAGYDKGKSEREFTPNPPPPPVVVKPNGPIRVISAVYGSWSKKCDATRYVARIVNHKRNYSFEVSNKMCGDPHHGQSKTLTIEYSCGSMMKKAVASEHKSIYLNCSY